MVMSKYQHKVLPVTIRPQGFDLWNKDIEPQFLLLFIGTSDHYRLQ